MMSDKPKPPFRLLPFEIPEVESKDKEVARLLEAGAARGYGGSRDEGGSTPRSRLDDRTLPESKPRSMLSMAVTFCLLACKTLSRLRSGALLMDFGCDEKREDEREGEGAEGKLAFLSIATIAEVPYPDRVEVLLLCDDVCGVLSRTTGDACRLCIPPSSSFIIL